MSLNAVHCWAMLRGNLAEFPLVGILQLLNKDKKTGAVRILEQHVGSIGVLNGVVVDAAYHPSRGDRALSLLNSLPAAPFEFDGNTRPLETTIERPTHELLLTLHDQRGQWLKIRERLKDWSVAPQWLSRPEKFGSAEQALIAELVNGKRPIERVLSESPLTPLRTAEVLIEMANLRMIALSPISQVTTPQQLVVLSVYHPDISMVFVDRALHRAWLQVLGPISLVVIAPKGQRQIFKVQPRDNISDRIMIPDAALRQMQLARGVKVTVIPTGEV
jgi:hypothetical protein